MTMLEMILAAQNGQAVGNLAQQFGLSEGEAEQAVRSLLPALSSGIKRNTASPEGLIDLLNALNESKYERYAEDPGLAAQPGARQDGNALLGHILGSKDVSRAAVARASAQSGIGSEILKQMLPIIVSIVIGALTKQGRNPLNDILGDILGGGARRGGGGARQPQGGNPYGDLADIIKGNPDQAGQSAPAQQTSERTAQSQPAQGRPKTPSAADIFGSMLDADGDGSAMDDIFDMVVKGAR